MVRAIDIISISQGYVMISIWPVSRFSLVCCSRKKGPELQPVNHTVLAVLSPEQVEVELWRADELEVRRGLSSELDEMWSYVARKSNPRWLWHAIDHHTGTV